MPSTRMAHVCVCIFCRSTLRDTLHHCRCLRSAYARAPWGVTSETPRFDAQRCSSTPFHCTVQYVVVPHHMSLMHVDLCVRACVRALERTLQSKRDRQTCSDCWVCACVLKLACFYIQIGAPVSSSSSQGSRELTWRLCGCVHVCLCVC